LPITLPLDDVNALWDPRIDLDQYGRMIRETFETLYREGATTGRLLVLHLHLWLIGQPFRIGSLDAALGRIVRRQRVWAATGAEHRLVPARSPGLTIAPARRPSPG
jgi:hypothetical protein